MATNFKIVKKSVSSTSVCYELEGETIVQVIFGKHKQVRMIVNTGERIHLRKSEEEEWYEMARSHLENEF